MGSTPIHYYKAEQGKWFPESATPEGLEKAIAKDARYQTTTAFSKPYTNSGPEPVRHGEFCLDFDDKKNPQAALEDARTLALVHLPELYGLDPYGVRFYLSGSKGFHVEIPKEFFGAAQGDIYLPLIHRRIAAHWKSSFNLPTLDMSLYCMGKGKMFRLPNIKRPNGFYKIPLTLEEFRDHSYKELLEMAREPRTIDEVDFDLEPCDDLVREYQEARKQVHQEKQSPAKISKPLTRNEIRHLSKNIAPCIKSIIRGMPPKSEKVNFNRLVLNLVKFFQTLKFSKEATWTAVKPFIENYPFSDSYNTPEKRLNHWREMWLYLSGREDAQFDCSYIKGMGLPGSAFECSECLKERKETKTTTFNACDLLKMEIPPIRWAIKDLLAEGVSLLAGKPKHGKSIMALNICLSVAQGSKALGFSETVQGPVLYLALEDTRRRLQSRMKEMLYDPTGHSNDDILQNLHLATEWPKMGSGGFAALEQEMKKKKLRMVVIDTLKMFRPPDDTRKRLYDQDYEPIARIKGLADKYNAAIVLIHHLRKSDAEDVMDTLSGSLGLTGATDANMVLTRTTGFDNAILHIVGRDVEAKSYAMEFEPRTLSWNIKGDASEVATTPKRQEILDAIRDSVHAVTRKDLAEKTGLKPNYISKALSAFLEDGSIKRVDKGVYIYNGGKEGKEGKEGNYGKVGNYQRTETFVDEHGNAVQIPIA